MLFGWSDVYLTYNSSEGLHSAFALVVGLNKDAKEGYESLMKMIFFVNILYNLWYLNIVSLF